MQPQDDSSAAHADTKYWVAFTRIPSIGPARTRTLEAAFGTMEAAWRASADELRAAGLDRRSLAQVQERRSSIDPDAEMAALERQGIGALPWSSPDYPALLKAIGDPPPVLFHRGELRPEDRRAVAVVGTRKATAYGREACASLVASLAASGVTIVSGMARGIDGIAHRTALEMGGRTVGVMASGLDSVYPPEHRELARRVAEAGVLVSEHPPGARPSSQTFPRRNRILSGLSLGVLVVEAPQASGAMWTVHWALEQGREVFAVPGSIFSPASQGANRLVQDGAKLVLSPEDVLEELNLSTLVAPVAAAAMRTTTVDAGTRAVVAPAPPPVAAPVAAAPKAEPVAGPEGDLLSLLADDPRHVDEVCRQAGLPITTVSSALTLLELKGLVRQVGAMHYVRTREPRSLYRSTSRRSA